MKTMSYTVSRTFRTKNPNHPGCGLYLAKDYNRRAAEQPEIFIFSPAPLTVGAEVATGNLNPAPETYFGRPSFRLEQK